MYKWLYNIWIIDYIDVLYSIKLLGNLWCILVVLWKSIYNGFFCKICVNNSILTIYYLTNI